MADLGRDFLRRLASWRTEGTPVSSLYLDVDGRRYPRKQDYELRGEELGRRLLEQASSLPRSARRSVQKDTDRARDFLSQLDRGPTRGLAMFCASEAQLWEAVRLPRPVRDRAIVAERPHLLPLEALVAGYESFCTALVDREKARLFICQMGTVQERSDLLDEVPGKHDQGGWSQARYQRHIEEHVGRHLKRVADVLLAFFKRRRFDHLILAGPEEVVPELERSLHDYVRQRVLARITLPISASPAEVLERSLAVEEGFEVERQRGVLDRLRAESAADRLAVTGLRAVLEALNDGRVATLVVPLMLEVRGARCPSCGRLFPGGHSCRICGASLQEAPDIVERAVEAAIHQSSRVETLAGQNEEEAQEFGALLRY